MPNARRITRLLASSGIAAALVTAATACGAGSKPSTSSPDSGAPSSEGASTSPPEEFGLSLADLTVRIENTERLIAACMNDAGFVYVALDAATVRTAMNSDQTAAGLSPEEYTQRFGLGITTTFDKPLITFAAGPQNNATLDALAASDQVAFRRSLWGEMTEWNHARALEEEDFSETGGCTRAAAEQVYAPGELTGTYVNPADKLLAQDRRMIAATKSYAECMRAAGFEFDDPEQVSDDLKERLSAIAQGQDPRSLTGPALDALTALQSEELAIAPVHSDCEDENIAPVQEAIEAELYGGSPT